MVFAASAWASKWTTPRRRGATAAEIAAADGNVIEWSPPRTIGIAPLAATSATLRLITAWARSMAIGVTGASPASTTSSQSSGSMSSCSELRSPAWYVACRIARGPKRAPERWLTASSNGAPTIAMSGRRSASAAASVT